MAEKQGAGGACEQVCSASAGAGELARGSHKGGTLELLLEKCLAIPQAEEGIPGKQTGLPWPRL